ncbi:MAG: AmmeMemoRadiSam system protein B [Betaproteobacteria bacterium]
MKATTRPAGFAGSWYPGTAGAINRELDAYLAAAEPARVPGRLVALVSPHAGLRYSGPVAAHGYRLLRDRGPATVVLVGPSHRVAFEGVALHGSGAWETPLGRAEVDADVAAAIAAAAPALVIDDPAVHREEHSLEMQLPFLQRVWPSFRIVPLMMGSQSRQEVEGLAGALSAALRGRDVLLVASSDLSHYEPAAVANRLDAVVVELLERFDEAALLARLESHANVACGGGPIVAVMRAARALGADRARVLKYGDSGDVEARDKSHVVGYLSAAMTAGEP